MRRGSALSEESEESEESGSRGVGESSMKKVIAAGVILVVAMTAFVGAQRRRGGGGMYGVKRPEHITWNSDFTFCRLAYRQAYDGDGGGWGVDYPRADTNLPIRLSELTRTPV